MSARAALVSLLVCVLPSCGGSTTSATGETSPPGAAAGTGGAAEASGSSEAGAGGSGAGTSGADAGTSGADAGTSDRGGSAGSAGGGGSSGTAGGASVFPTGTWTTCAEGVSTPPSGSNFLNSAGFEETAMLTVAKDAGTLLVTWVDQNGATTTLHFDEEGDAAASLATATVVSPETGAVCVQGPGAESVSPATLGATSGAMTYRSGAVFVFLDGTLQADGGTCGPTSSPGSLWIACTGGPSPVVDEAPPSPVPAFPTGAYACRSQIETYYETGGMKQILAAGSQDAKLTLTQDGAELTVDVTKDAYATGTMHLAMTSVTTAVSTSDATLTAPCGVPVQMPSNAPEPLPLGSASLVLDGATLFVSFVGTMPSGSSCAGAKKAGTWICTKG